MNKTWLITGTSSGLWRSEFDITDNAAIRPVVGRAFAELGGIDVVFSNAPVEELKWT
jgi:NAD(P)-dependent dehydrogenase (short-subunit alcohol dehydrogenase family)